MIIPIIETERLRLRAHRPADLADCAAMWGDARVTRHIGGKPFAIDEVWAKILRYAGHWSLLGYGYWVIEDRASGGFLGEAGLADFKRCIGPGFDGAPEIGWVLAPARLPSPPRHPGPRAVLGWADRHLNRIRTVCLIDPENRGSVRVAEKCGYREFHRTTYKDHPVVLFEREETEDEAGRDS